MKKLFKVLLCFSLMIASTISYADSDLSLKGEKSYSYMIINLEPKEKINNITNFEVVRKGDKISFKKAGSTSELYSPGKYFLDNEKIEVSNLEDNDIIILNFSDGNKAFKVGKKGFSIPTYEEIDINKVEIDEYAKTNDYNIKVEIDNRNIFMPKLVIKSNKDSVEKIFINNQQLKKTENNTVEPGEYKDTEDGFFINAINDGDKVIFKDNQDNIIGAYKYNRTNRIFKPLSIKDKEKKQDSEGGTIKNEGPKESEKESIKKDKVDKIVSIDESSDFNSYSLAIKPQELYEKIAKVYVNDIEYGKTEYRISLFGNAFYKDDSSKSIVFDESTKIDSIKFQDSEGNILGSFTRLDGKYVSNSEDDEDEDKVDETVDHEDHEQNQEDVNTSTESYSIKSIEEHSIFFDKYISIDPKAEISKIGSIYIDNVKCDKKDYKGSVIKDHDYYIDEANGLIYISKSIDDGSSITFKNKEDKIIGSFVKENNSFKSNETEQKDEEDEEIKEGEEETKEDVNVSESYTIDSISVNASVFDNYIAIEPKAEISNIDSMYINDVKYIRKESKTSVIEGSYAIDEEKGYIYIYERIHEGSNITFKNKDGKIIGSFTEKDGIFHKSEKENTNQKELKVKIDGSFEPAIVGQKGYDAISGATGSVSENKNSNVNVYVQEVEKGQDVDENQWKLVKDTKIRFIKEKDGNKSQGLIDQDDSGMKVGYNPYESSLILQGEPKKAGDYNISIKVVDNYGRTASSNSLPFKIYDLNDITLKDQLLPGNFKNFEHGDHLKWDMEPWEIHTFGGKNETITVPKELNVWFGSHQSGTYGYLGRARRKGQDPIKQTLIIDQGTNLTLTNMQILSSVDIIVKNGGKLNLNDSSLYGRVIVEDGGILQVNYNENENKLTTGSSINGKIILKDGATLENSSIYSNANSLTDGDEAKRIIDPVVEVSGNVTIKGKVFIRGDESPTGKDELTDTEYKGQPALKIKDGNLILDKESTLGLYGGGTKATTTNGGDGLILENGIVSGDGVLVAVGGNGGGLSTKSKGGDAVSGQGTIENKESYLSGGYSSVDKKENFGAPYTENIVISENTKCKAEHGKSINSIVNSTIQPQYWNDITKAPGSGEKDDPLNYIIDKKTEEETDPQETDPEETDPEETDPEETDPEETDPEETDPEETDPQDTDPEETNPDGEDLEPENNAKKELKKAQAELEKAKEELEKAKEEALAKSESEAEAIAKAKEAQDKLKEVQEELEKTKENAQAQAENELEKAKAELEKTKSDLGIAKSELEKAKSDLEKVKAELLVKSEAEAKAKAELEKAKANAKSEVETKKEEKSKFEKESNAKQDPKSKKDDYSDKIRKQLEINRGKLAAAKGIKLYMPESYKLYKVRIDKAIANAEKAIKQAEDYLSKVENK